VLFVIENIDSYFICIFVIKHPDDGHGSDRSILVKNNNNMCLNIFINVQLLVSYRRKYSLMYGHGKKTNNL